MSRHSIDSVVHDAGGTRFVLSADGHTAELRYRMERPDRVNLAHTYTPPELRGRGIAGTLTRAALEWARESGLTVHPGCPYVAAYLERHPEYQELLAL